MNNLVDGFVLSAERYPDNNALFVDGEYYSFRELGGYVLGVQNHLDRVDSGDCLVGIYAYRSLTMYTAILSILYKGKGYVPLNPILPPKKNKKVLLKSGVKTILTEKARLKDLLGILPEDGDSFTIIVLDEDNAEFGSLSKIHNIFCVDKIQSSHRAKCHQKRRYDVFHVWRDSIIHLLMHYMNKVNQEEKKLPWQE